MASRTDTYLPYIANTQAIGGFGFTPSRDQLITATAIALAENPNVDAEAVNTKNKDGTKDYGLWQINDKWQRANGDTAYNALKAKGKAGSPWRWPNDLTVAPINAAVMIVASNRMTDWSAWTTYKTGAYQQYLGRATTAVDSYLANPPAPGDSRYPDVPGDVPGDKGEVNEIGGSLFGWADALGRLLSSLLDPKLWLRVVSVVGGLLLAAWGFAKLTGAR